MYLTVLEIVVSVLCKKMIKYSKGPFVLEFVWPQVLNLWHVAFIFIFSLVSSMKYRSYACKCVLKTRVCWRFTPCQLVDSYDWYVGTDIPKDLPACVSRVVQVAWSVTHCWTAVLWVVLECGLVYRYKRYRRLDCHQYGGSAPPHEVLAHHPRRCET